MKAFAIILAAGRGERFGGDELCEDLGGRPVWKWSYDQFLAHPEISGVGLVASESNIDAIQRFASNAEFVVQGGLDRTGSVRIGMEKVPPDVESIVIHDGARPFVSA